MHKGLFSFYFSFFFPATVVVLIHANHYLLVSLGEVSVTEIVLAVHETFLPNLLQKIPSTLLSALFIQGVN